MRDLHYSPCPPWEMIRCYFSTRGCAQIAHFLSSSKAKHKLTKAAQSMVGAFNDGNTCRDSAVREVQNSAIPSTVEDETWGRRVKNEAIVWSAYPCTWRTAGEWTMKNGSLGIRSVGAWVKSMTTSGKNSGWAEGLTPSVMILECIWAILCWYCLCHLECNDFDKRVEKKKINCEIRD